MSAADGKLRAANLDIDAPPAPRRLLLAIYGTQRRPRFISWAHEKHVRAYARRWWVVEAPDVGTARLAIVSADAGRGPCATTYLGVRRVHRVVDCGRNTAGGPPLHPTRRSS